MTMIGQIVRLRGGHGDGKFANVAEDQQWVYLYGQYYSCTDKRDEDGYPIYRQLDPKCGGMRP
jgi:hypothetical protein